MRYRYLLVLLLLGACTTVSPPPAKAVSGCEVSTSAATYANGFFMGAFNCDTSGNVRMTLGTLISGEDQTNNLLMTSGGAVRTTTFSSVTSATTSSVTTVPTGVKGLKARMTNATSESKAFTMDIYVNEENTTTGGIKVCTITIPSTASVTHIEDQCPPTSVAGAYWYYTVTAYTSASAAPITLYAMY